MNRKNYKKIDVAVLGLGGMGSTHVGAAKASPYVNRIIGYEPETQRAALKSQKNHSTEIV